jgi:hypothetical protein
MFVCCECFVLSGTGLSDELITRPEKSYRLWCVVVCDLETSKLRRPWPALGRSATKKYTCINTIHIYVDINTCINDYIYIYVCILFDWINYFTSTEFYTFTKCVLTSWKFAMIILFTQNIFLRSTF